MVDLIDGEIDTIEKYITPDSIVFDIGGCRGEWTNEVLTRGLASFVHVFEPIKDSYNILSKELLQYPNKVKVNNKAVSNKCGSIPFWYYKDLPVLSTQYKRNEFIVSELNLQEPTKVKVPVITIDRYCEQYEISFIDFLKIDTEGSELDVLQGADNLLSKNKISHIQFEYGGCFLDAGITLKRVFDYLKNYGYQIAKIGKGPIKYIDRFTPEMEDYVYCNFFSTLSR